MSKAMYNPSNDKITLITSNLYLFQIKGIKIRYTKKEELK